MATTKAISHDVENLSETMFDQLDWIGLGSLLREKRNSNGFSIAAAALTLCLTSKHINALENGSGEIFPGEMLRETCGRRYATLLGLDWALITQPLPPAHLQSGIEGSVDTLPSSTPPAGQAVKRTLDFNQKSYIFAILTMLISIWIGWQQLAMRPEPVVATAPGSVAASMQTPIPAPVSAGDAPTVSDPPKLPLHSGAHFDPPVDEIHPLEEAPGAPAMSMKPIESVVEINGADENKPANYFFVKSRGASVLLKKGAADESEAIRLELPKSSTKRVPIGKNELFKIVEGENIEMFYQGRSVRPNLIANGTWIQFSPKVLVKEIGR